MTQETRRRGRPQDGVDRRAAILDVARQLFAERGFRGASLRAIAAGAGVDASLISHYFGDKSQLLAATLKLPIDPVIKIREATAGGSEGLGERLLTTFLTTWDPHPDVFSTIFLNALTGGVGAEPASSPASSPLAQFAQDVVSAAVREQLEGQDADLRANLVVAHVLGIASTRYLTRLEPLASASVEEVAALCGPAVQRIVDGSAPLP